MFTIPLKKVLAGLLLVGGLTTISSCDKEDDVVSAEKTASGTLTGAQQVPAVTTTATGSTSGTFNTTSRVMTYTFTYSGLSGNPTMGHLHQGAAGAAGPPFVTFSNIPAAVSGTFSGTATFTADQATALQAGNVYVNIHTARNPGGEIRGQVTLK